MRKCKYSMHGVCGVLICFNRYINMSVSVICLSIYICKRKKDWIMLGEIGSQLPKLRNTQICYLPVGDPGELVVSKGRRNEMRCTSLSRQAGRRKNKDSSFHQLLFYSDPQQIRWFPPTLRRALCFTGPNGILWYSQVDP